MLKTKLFYSHLINLKEIIREINKIKLQQEDQDEIYSLVDDIIHHHVFDSLLEILPEEHHEVFIEKFTIEPQNPELLEFLKIHAISDPEIKVITSAEFAKNEILLEVLISQPKRKSGHGKR